VSNPAGVNDLRAGESEEARSRRIFGAFVRAEMERRGLKQDAGSPSETDLLRERVTTLEQRVAALEEESIAEGRAILALQKRVADLERARAEKSGEEEFAFVSMARAEGHRTAPQPTGPPKVAGFTIDESGE
jgi:hypothetical protein